MSEILVIGGGPGGSTAASLLVKHGRSVTLLEREVFPRFQIGESLLPYNNDIFERLGLLDLLDRSGFYPKFGAEFLTGDGDVRYTFRFRNNLPARYGKSFQVKRADFDHLLLKHAASRGVDVREGMTVTAVDLSDPERAILTARNKDGRLETFESRFVIDATGHGALIGAKQNVKTDDDRLRKVSFFAHYRNVAPSAQGDDSGNTVIAIVRNAWFWLIPLSEETTSVGVVLDRDDFVASGLSPEEILDGAIEQTPYVASRLRKAEMTTPVYARKNFSYRVDRIAGPNFAMVGDAAGFIDPIFSTGVFMAMKSAELVADGVEKFLRTGQIRALMQYQKSFKRALERYFDFIANFYRREFLEVFLQPAERFGLLPVIVGVLAGNVFSSRRDRAKLALFFALVQIQKRHAISPRISWDNLPSVALQAPRA